ncbi:endolytic transglycosylase MltG [Streptomyces sp. NTH33]|uniref:endolytic transglycosylase MltG n=1 Tax=Streptomyces sp. NTH33 TaxID=1735453 RepID=UPI000DAA0E69|nr:endolytic transglycosylase MltG [Streptomyces sp. NTH33]PZH09809.1 endolytic transglycosylase MltG [Streptomyces sp. NTH33]
MTEYGRGPGSEPWHPDDPLYGDGGWGGQQAQAGQQPPYGGQPQHHPQQPQYGEWGHEQQAGYGGQYQQQYGEQGHQQSPHYDQQGHQQPPHYDQQGHQQPPHYDQQGHQQPPHYDQQGHQQPPHYDQQGHHQQYTGHFQDQQQYQQGGWDGAGGQQQPPYPADPTDPYGRQAAAHGAEQPDFYGTPDAYPPPQPPSRRRAEPEPRPDWDPEPEPDQDEHAFFAGGGDEDDDADADDPRNEGRGRGDRKGRGGKGKDKGKKRRSGCACLVVVMVFGGGAVGVTYYGYQFYQNRFGAAPDYAGDGNSEQVTVVIPKGAGGYVIGQELKKAGVVASVGAFVSAQEANPNGKQIQDGVYTLKKHMSAASAVQLMLSPESRSNLIIAEGKRNADVYKLIDMRLELDEGTTAKVAKSEWKSLGLPAWAMNHKNVKDPLEGFLYPSSYSVAKGQKPKDVLKQMVTRASAQYTGMGIEKEAKRLGLDSPWELLTVASVVQVEGKYQHDFTKVARVIYNRLKPDNVETVGRLEMDSTVNYLKGQSTLDIGQVKDLRKIEDPYNTYNIKGLPPGPISNPGKEAIEAAMKPTPGPWYYFVSINEDKTVFSVTNEEHNKKVAEYERERKKSGQ